MPKNNTSPVLKPQSPIVLNRSNASVKKLNSIIERLKARHRRHYRDNNFHLWADILLASTLVGLVVIVVWLIFWQPQAEFSLISHFTNTRILSGQSEEIIIAYKNGEDGFITGTNLKLDLPNNFVIESASPKEFFDAKSNTFNLGDLNKNAHGEIRLRGTPRGEVGDRQAIGLNLTYQFGLTRRLLLDSLVYIIDGSTMELNLELPNETYKDVSFSGSVEVKNTSQTNMENAVLSFPSLDWEIIPDELALEDGHITLPSIAPGASTKIMFSAINKQATNNTSTFVVDGLFLIGDKELKQVELTKNITVSEPSLLLTSVFTDKALSGNVANAFLTLKNNGQTDISNLSLSIESKRNTTSVSSVTTTEKDFTVTNNILGYSGNLKAEEKINISSTITLEHGGTNLNDFVNLNILVSYTMADKIFKYSVPMPKLKINSNLTVTSAGYYYGPQGDQLGIGPIPPKVDIPTTYWVIWEANNLGNDIANFEVSADLPVNVVWLDQKSVVAGVVTYSPVGRRILWRIDKLIQTGGNYRVSFAISLVPRNQDLGTVPILLSNIKFRANDLYTEDVISKDLANITTNIEQDRKAAGKGKVEPLE